MAVEFKYDNESIEYTGYRCAAYKHSIPGDFREDIQHLRKKYEKEIRSINETKITSTSSLAIDVLKDLLINSEQDSVKLNTAKLLLELGNYSSQNINLTVDDTKNKTDEELIKELNELLLKVPGFKTKLGFKNSAQDVESMDNTESDPSNQAEKPLSH